MRKGQIATIDLFIALVVFFILIITVIQIWSLYNHRLGEDMDDETLQLLGFQISDFLVKSPGFPTAWEENVSSLEVIGLASSDRILSQEKINAFITLDYSLLKEKFNIEPFEYKFRIKDMTNNVINESGLNFTGDKSVVTERYVMVKNEKRVMEFTLWK